ncbi:MAG: AIM24 family protein [Myxococcota bacterium]
MAHFEIIDFEGQKMVKVTIQNETVRAEAGALHYMRGNIEMTSKAPSAGGMLKAMVSGETMFKPTYTGHGEVYFGPPMFGEYVTLHLNNEEWVLDRGAYVCSDIGIEVDVFRNKAVSGLVGGEGLFQTKVKGTGTVILQAPGKVQQIQLQGEKLSVDGSFAVARHATLNYSVQRASKSLVGSFTSGEGLLNTFTGQGVVLLAPVPNLYQSLIAQCRYIPTAAGSAGGAVAGGAAGGLIGRLMGGGGMMGRLIGIGVFLVMFFAVAGCSLLSALFN